ncbi:type II toxin-antitoxin system RelE/ParE family toxin [Salinarimonas chemoclinalis]|uniref:type II toxin-antitoxin system RelE/ParE family toxin n=1 Tax=Salinarimonas chemoclinalis TaxID=3241599 RepID=UPI003555D260
MKRYRVRLHPRVHDDFRAIERSMRPHAGAATTKQILRELRQAALALADTPHRGTLRTELFSGLRVIGASPRGSIAFSVDDAKREVFVHIVSYGGFDWESRVRDRRRH